MAETLGNYLLDELFRRGVKHLFGVPGDYVLLFDKVIESHPIQFINTTRENTAGYMADAYARARGLGAVCITYGVGLNIANAISQAYVENSPVILISGAPGTKELQNSPYLHHLIPQKRNPRAANTQMEIFSKITVAQTKLDDIEKAPGEIQRVINEAYWQKGPVYIELPRDMVLKELHSVSVPPVYPPKGDPDLLQKKLNAAKALLENSKFPLLWIGHEAMRLQVADGILAFAEKHQIPIITTLTAKSALDETHHLVLGVYQGEMSRPEVKEYADKADGIIQFGVLQSDMDTGLFTTPFDQIPRFSVRLDSYLLKDFIEGIAALKMKREESPLFVKANGRELPISIEGHLTIQKTFDCLQKRIHENHLLISDVGDCLFGATDLSLPKNSYYSNAYFESLGFAVPGSIGLAIACPEKRVIALLGDGAFQMTGTELSTAIRYNLDPILILFNNQGYGTERPLIEGIYNDIVNWNYAKLPEFLGGGKAIKVSTVEAFENALDKALSTRGCFHLIEVTMDKLDFSNAAKRFTAIAQKSVRKSNSLAN